MRVSHTHNNRTPSTEGSKLNFPRQEIKMKAFYIINPQVHSNLCWRRQASQKRPYVVTRCNRFLRVASNPN